MKKFDYKVGDEVIIIDYDSYPKTEFAPKYIGEIGTIVKIKASHPMVKYPLTIKFNRKDKDGQYPNVEEFKLEEVIPVTESSRILYGK